uniref:Uncharacterized protein n=1 Tax=Syphacia muris TaxID=451379 RepID=A0A0N5AZJ0_9BILA
MCGEVLDSFHLNEYSSDETTAFSETLNWFCCGLRRRKADGTNRDPDETYKATTSAVPDLRLNGWLLY